MESNREIRKKALKSLEGRWREGILISLLATLLGGMNVLAFMLELPVMLMMERSGGQLYAGLTLTAHIVLGLIVGGMVELGQNRCYLLSRAGEEPGVGELFSMRSLWFKCLTLRLLRCGEAVLRMLLLIVPGVISLFQYALAPFLMAQDPDIEAPAAVKTSSILMKGYKRKLWRFVWGYSGWFLLSLCTFGLGFLFLTPYFKAGMAEFYAQRVAEHDADLRRVRLSN